MAIATAKIKIITVGNDTEFQIDPTTETILDVKDNGDGTICVFVITYIRKGGQEFIK